MASIRDVYFSKIKYVEKSSYFSNAIFKEMLIKFNNFKSELELTKNFDSEMKNEKEFNKAFEDILNGRMFEYVINECTFDNNKFYVDENVLIPRQETEELVVNFCKYFKELKFDPTSSKIADICTGSGCIGVSIAKRFKDAKVYLTDISKSALEIAKKNAKSNNVECEIFEGNMLNPLVKEKVKVDCIVCNPPYINNITRIDKRTWNQEPHSALLANPVTKYYELLFSKACKVLNNRYFIALEIGEKMKRTLNKLAKEYFPFATIKFERDLDKKWRFMYIYSENRYKNAPLALKNHGIIGFPTETVMGLGIVYDDKVAFDKLNKIKNRPENKPYSLMIHSIKEITKYAYISKEELKVAKAFLPGPLTLLLKKKRLPKWVTLGSDYVGIRIPNISSIRRVIKETGKPILAPSANKSGEAPATTNKEIKEIFGNELDYIVKGDALKLQPSTIVMIDKDVKIIREGPISKDQIIEVLKNENINRK